MTDGTTLPSVSLRVVVRHRGRELDGVVHDGESWARAARRVSASAIGDPMPVDLSGETKIFVIDHDITVTLRAMTREDLPDMLRWRQADHVRAWWQPDGEPTLTSVTERYGPRIDGTTPTRMWVALVNGRAVGFVQDYRIADYPDYARQCGHDDAIGVDYAIGEEAWLGKGLGPRLLWAWMARARRRFPAEMTYFAGPDHTNEASLRTLDKSGFVRGVTFEETEPDGSVTTVVGCTLDVERVIG